jgi:hypothetical protein
MRANSDKNSPQFQNILVVHIVFSVVGQEKTPIAAAPDNVAFKPLISFSLVKSAEFPYRSLNKP